jgi:hypothetical protein
VGRAAGAASSTLWKVDFGQGTHQAGFTSALISNKDEFRELDNMFYTELSEVMNRINKNLYATADNM